MLASADNITEIECTETCNQVCNNELGIGTTTRLLLSEQSIEDDFVGTSVESRFYASVRAFYVKSPYALVMW